MTEAVLSIILYVPMVCTNDLAELTLYTVWIVHTVTHLVLELTV